MQAPVILINPPTPRPLGMLNEHLGLAYLAASLKAADIGVEVLDTAVNKQTGSELLDQLRSMRQPPMLLGFTVIDKGALICVRELCAQIKKSWPKTRIVLGGYFATFWYDAILEWPEIDFIVRGEGERTLIALAKTLLADHDPGDIAGIAYRYRGKIECTRPRSLVPVLDELPFPRRQHLKKVIQSGGIPTVYASRGCYYQCSFCQVCQLYRQQPGPPYRSRSAGNITAELNGIASSSRARAVLFTDDEFIGAGERGKARARNLGSQLTASNLQLAYGFQCRVDSVDYELFSVLRESGLRVVSVGLESMVERSLTLFNKKVQIDQNLRAIEILESIDLAFSIGFIFFDPYTTVSELAENVHWLHHIPVFPKGINGLVVLRGTVLETHFRKAKLVKEYDMYLEVKPLDPAIGFFAKALDVYSPLYIECTNHLQDVESLLLTNGYQHSAIRYRLNELNQKLRGIHLDFLDEAIQVLKSTPQHMQSVVPAFEGVFRDFTQETRQFKQSVDETVLRDEG